MSVADSVPGGSTGIEGTSEAPADFYTTDPTASSAPPAGAEEHRLGTHKPSLATAPWFKLVLGDDDWTDAFLFGNTSLDSQNSNGTFTLRFDLRQAGDLDENDVLQPGSRLDKITRLRKEPHRDIAELFCGYDGKADTQFFTGLIDKIQVNYLQNIVTITGRDRSALMQESFTHQQLRNATVKDVIEAVAKKHGLDLEIVDPKHKVGEIFEDEQFGLENVPSSGYNDWDLVTKMADRIAYTTYVEGNKLVFIPYTDFTEELEFVLGKNIVDLTLIKNFNTAESRVVVEFTSVDQQGKKTEVVTVGNKSETPGESAVYRIPVPPNTPKDGLQRIAESFVKLAVQTEYTISIETVGHPKQSLRKKILLSGTNTSFDRSYRIANISWQFGFEHGWTATLEGFSIPEGTGPDTPAGTEAQNVQQADLTGGSSGVGGTSEFT